MRRYWLILAVVLVVGCTWPATKPELAEAQGERYSPSELRAMKVRGDWERNFSSDALKGRDLETIPCLNPSADCSQATKKTGLNDRWNEIVRVGDPLPSAGYVYTTDPDTGETAWSEDRLSLHPNKVREFTVRGRMGLDASARVLTVTADFARVEFALHPGHWYTWEQVAEALVMYDAKEGAR